MVTPLQFDPVEQNQRLNITCLDAESQMQVNLESSKEEVHQQIDSIANGLLRMHTNGQIKSKVQAN